MADRYLARIGGETKQVQGTAVSAGVANAGDLVALGTDGRLDSSMMPPGIGADTQVIAASESLSAGVFVNIWSDGGTAKVRLADNSNNRPADGFVLDAVASGANASVYPLDGTNSEMSALTPGAKYWLGVAGAVIAAPLDETDDLNIGKVSQYLGKAKSATELITVDDTPVVL